MGTLLPAVQFLQKSIQRHLDDVSKLYVTSPTGGGGGAFTVASWSSQGCSPCCQTWAQRPRVGLTDTSPVLPHSCDWNRYNLQYALAVSKQRGLKRPSEPPGSNIVDIKPANMEELTEVITAAESTPTTATPSCTAAAKG